MEDLNIALLIDSDNVSPRYISGILSELSKYGKITIRRMYGDWSQDLPSCSPTTLPARTPPTSA